MQNNRILGDYNIIKQIGQGPLGTVYLAEHRFMKKHFALKVLPEELASDRFFVQRFEDEIAKLSKLDHPHIVKVHNISSANGLFFLVTDCIVDEMGENTSLAQYILSLGRKLNEDELYQILLQIADALDYAHSIKCHDGYITHGSLKLNNILISKKTSTVHVYLSDFGLSSIIGAGALLSKTFKAVAEALEIDAGLGYLPNCEEKYPSPPISEEKYLPLHASFLQTFAFLSPEQKQAKHKLSKYYKVDVYAFGVLAYYLMTGRFPEGYFELPSSIISNFKWNWDDLIKGCLKFNPEGRIEKLMPCLKNIHSIVSKSENLIVSPTKTDFQNVGITPHPTADLLSIQNKEIDEERELCAVSVAPMESHHQVIQEPQKKIMASDILQPVINRTQLERPEKDLDPGAIFSMDSTVTHYIPEQKEVKDINPILTEMSVIKGGSFLRGSNSGNRDSLPAHQVNVDSFAIDIHPVTNEQFVRFLEVLGGEKDSNHNDVIRLKDSRIKRSGGKLSIESGYSKHPVVGVTWYGAAAYAKWVGKRLPTEAEWEVAAKGGNETARYPTGEDIEKNQANFFSSDTTAVMSYAPNGYNIYDMAGNVYEWCQDWYGYNYYETSVQEPDNPQGPLQGVYRVLRGGCWKSLKDDLLCSRRHRNNPGTVNGTYGFRCAANVR